MYGLLWRALPGSWLVRLMLLIVLLAAVFMLLMQVVFPWVATLMPYNDVAV
ncbi:hypothetical protein [Corynebacterium halotolerans]|uniref:Uncharacterized protein n=1 Tax=Corynebacterium halotolerans YIM 70093 = DSM 44683 TaxID=1121362 RepID=M1NU86_9CORY|nr:hypothetical protein [Corynebacterium halotolerans]AGF71065.1 hypothetical protein A605_00245 [Corynebacterium halotolerans YIM 70093 = DSM 44683]